MDKCKEQNSAKVIGKKRRDEERQEIQNKRRRLETGAKSMEMEADKLVELAENTFKLTFLAKSNALRRGAKLKRDEIVKVDEVLAQLD